MRKKGWDLELEEKKTEMKKKVEGGRNGEMDNVGPSFPSSNA